MKIIEIKAPKQYCYSCGSLMKSSIRWVTYDNDTGEPYYAWNYECPNNIGKWFFGRHETEATWGD